MFLIWLKYRSYIKLPCDCSLNIVNEECFPEAEGVYVLCQKFVTNSFVSESMLYSYEFEFLVWYGCFFPRLIILNLGANLFGLAQLDFPSGLAWPITWIKAL